MKKQPLVAPRFKDNPTPEQLDSFKRDIMKMNNAGFYAISNHASEIEFIPFNNLAIEKAKIADDEHVPVKSDVEKMEDIVSQHRQQNPRIRGLH